MADGGVALQAVELVAGEDVGHEPHPFMVDEGIVLDGDDAGGLLAPVLLGEEAGIGLADGLGGPEDPEEAAMVLDLLVQAPGLLPELGIRQNRRVVRFRPSILHSLFFILRFGRRDRTIH